LLIGGVVLSSGKYTAFVGYGLIAYGLWRSLSKNKHKRSQELYVFDNYFMKLKQKFFKYKASFLEHQEYKIFKCPNCSQKLRVPRKKGKLVITCKKCRNEFKGKS
jgi:hypothetical protein